MKCSSTPVKRQVCFYNWTPLKIGQHEIQFKMINASVILVFKHLVYKFECILGFSQIHTYIKLANISNHKSVLMSVWGYCPAGT